MDPNYEAKFEEMKKYIPFLEAMIKKLDTPSAGNNPRQAQLDKIRSLRDLLMDKKKRMKMENLLKCEQVLINLYSKVEQRDTLPGIIGPNRSIPEAPEPPDITGLDVLRTKLKTVAFKDTLPEIQRLNETEETCTPGSKEPALFQRRPNKASKSPSRESRKSSTSETHLPHKTKRNYTRVLVSPDPNDRHWKSDGTTDKHIYSRRSPHWSPKKLSPGHIKKDKNKTSRHGNKGEAKNFNIMLELPQDRLNSLSREDLGNRIINCSDNDVNIDTLRVLRTQILDELKCIGATDDISELLFKSSKKKARKKIKKDEVEEGELSDSESEAIKSIYGSINIVDEGNHQLRQIKGSDVEDDKQPHKIQINLVINNQDKEALKNSHGHKTTVDQSEFEMFDNKDLETNDSGKTNILPGANKDLIDTTSTNVKGIENNKQLQSSLPSNIDTNTNKKDVIQDVITIDEEDVAKSDANAEKQNGEMAKSDDDVSYIGSTTIDTEFLLETLEGKNTRPKKSFKPNFYNEQASKNTSTHDHNQSSHDHNPEQNHDDFLPSQVNAVAVKDCSNTAQENCQSSSESCKLDDLSTIEATKKKCFNKEEIPLLNTDSSQKPKYKEYVSEIDILQALKNDILSENIAIPNTEPTPALHQPQITKVVDAKSITKRTISIEKYKQKSVAPLRTPLFAKGPKYSNNMSKEEYTKKQSLKLTEKECERFKFPAKLALHSSDEEEDVLTPALNDIYDDLSPISPKQNLAPESPENVDVISAISTPPIIIPVDPLPAKIIEASRSDVDMRILSPNGTVGTDPQPDHNKKQTNSEISKKPLLADPRVRRDHRAINPDRTPIPGNYQNMTPNRTPSYSNDDERSSIKHIYAPIIPTHEPSLDYRERSVSRDYNRDLQREPNFDTRAEERRLRWEPLGRPHYDDLHIDSSVHRDVASDYQKTVHSYDKYESNSSTDRHPRDNRDDYSRIDCPKTPVHHFGRPECPSTPTPSFGRNESPRTPVHPFGRTDCPSSFERDSPMTPSHPFGREMPMTPSHPFGRSDVPTTSYGRNEIPLTPSHSFGRGEIPLTPSHPFGRGEMPLTPSHPFGRGEMPLTPSHPFGRGEMPMTPNHPFGRSERPMTPNHPFGRSDYSQNKCTQKFAKDPRLNRSNEYDGISKRFDREYYERWQPETSKPLIDYQPPATFQSCTRERSVGGINARHDAIEQNLGRTRDDEWDQKHSKNRSRISSKCDFAPEDDNSRDCNKYGFRKSFPRAQSIGRFENRHSDDLSNDRAPSVGRNYNNTLSVESQSGRPFVIDTSVNSTFQKFLSDKGLKEVGCSFDARRKRASSVGRYLGCDYSAGPGRKDYDKNFRRESTSDDIRKTNISKPCSSTHNQVTSDYKKLVNFVRARSIGREVSLADNVAKKSFKEVKADLKSFSISSNKSRQRQEKRPNEKIMNYRDPYTRKEARKMQQENRFSKTQISYSPRNNSRDPRMHRESQRNIKDRYIIDNRQRKSGIVYSNDNIANGSILGTVKNYKIPKIKKTTEEIENKVNPISTTREEMPTGASQKETESSSITIDEKVAVLKEKKKILKHETKVESRYSPKIGKNKEISASSPRPGIPRDRNTLDDENSPKHTLSGDDSKRLYSTSSRGKSLSCDQENLHDETIPNPRKSKKAVIRSESEDDSTIDTVLEKKKNVTESDNDIKGEVAVTKEENCFKVDDGNNVPSDRQKMNNSTNVPSFIIDHKVTMDDFDACSDPNITSDIASLIDSLDNDISSKTYSICNIGTTVPIQEEGISKLPEIKESDIVQESPHVSETINHDMNKPSIAATPELEEDGVNVKSDDNNSSSELSVDKLDEQKIKDKEFDSSKLNDFSNSGTENLVVVSTTETKISPNEENKQVSTRSGELNDIQTCSTAGSTIHTVDPVEDRTLNDILPDSTKEYTAEGNPHVTSTDVSPEDTNKVSGSESSRPTTQIESIGNLISMLQDKSKRKEILSMLGDEVDKSKEIDKFKKNLVKMLSEIVSDDENDAQDNEATLKNDSEKIENSSEHVNDSQIDSKKGLKENEENFEKAENNSPLSEPDGSAEIQENTEHLPKKQLRKTSKKPKKDKANVKQVLSKNKIANKNRVTRSKTAKPKGRPSRELKQLQESIKEMFMSDDILNATGIRMCRLAKLVDNKNNQDEDSSAPSKEVSPVVVLQKFKATESEDRTLLKVRKKPGPKSKPKPADAKNSSGTPHIKNKSGPKSKTKIIAHDDSDPYAFDTDSYSDITTTKSVHSNYQDSTDSDSNSLASFISSGSSEVLADLKKKTKRKRRAGWKSGVISKRKKKPEPKQSDDDVSTDDKKLLSSDIAVPQRKTVIPDKNCFTDKTYCFLKHTTTYSCRLCEYTGPDIINHYKKQHPHSEIPLSRLSPSIAENAIYQSAFVDFQAISKVPTDKYVCRFCFQVFKRVDALETFFWHIVSIHTGEYKHPCPECLNLKSCPFNLDIPPPPKDVKGQLIGYICEKCNFTQISLENLKTHVTVRHNDEQTSVCTINLSDMNEKMIKILMKRSLKIEAQEPRKLRSSNQSSTGFSDDRTDISGSTELGSEQEIKQILSNDKNLSSDTHIVSKIRFEEDIDSEFDDLTPVNPEKNDKTHTDNANDANSDPIHDTQSARSDDAGNSDVLKCPHFKICYSESGTKEYVCCVNGKDNHYKTSLLISMKKHIQTKHIETWDGYCFICEVIVTSQGVHLFKECLQHYVDKHMDNFPMLEVIQQPPIEKNPKLSVEIPLEKPTSPAPNCPLITVRPINELINERVRENTSEGPPPNIDNVDSLSTPTIVAPLPSPSYPETVPVPENVPISSRLPPTVKRISATPEEIHKYEEVQAHVMSNKHQVVLQTMMTDECLVKIYKCAGRFCSFTSDFAEAAWSHASTHQREGGENALICTYCDFDSKKNAPDLVTHVFKVHGSCRYSCGVCFYRAAASQLVQAHIDRVHGQVWSEVKVLESTTNYATKELVVPLSRELAVKYYTCVNDEPNCKYKTYILDKFTEHLAKHDSPLKCSVCSSTFPNVADLIQHLKSHGMNLYQCTWCIHGAENETDLLAHASARHPSKPPQAYVRTVNSKDPSKQMVLPLAKLNKAVVMTQIVKPSTNCEDPVREAIRSIDLERLIGSVATPNVASDDTAPFDLVDEDDALEVPLSPNEPEPDMTIPDLSTSLPATTEDENLASRVTPVLKTEPLDKPVTLTLSQDVISLDSDEDEPTLGTTKNIIDLSEDAPATLRRISTEFRVPHSSLFKCARCYMTCKTFPAFKRHINVCYPTGTTLKCAHCAFDTEMKDSLYFHYNFVHIKEAKPVPKKDSRTSKSDPVIQTAPTVNVYICGVCHYRDKALSIVRNHLKIEHKMTNLSVTSKFGSNSKDIEYTVQESSPPKKSMPKRKLSGSSLDSPLKRIRYSLKDLDQIPVKPILDDSAYCAECDFNTKVRLNLIRHLQLHADKTHIVPNTVPVNPVPHLETNEKHFDRMVNLASSSIEVSRPEKTSKAECTSTVLQHIQPEKASRYPKYVPDRQRHTCGATGCSYISVDQAMLKRHWEALHSGMTDYHCVHCPPNQQLDTSCSLTAARIIGHLKMHDTNLYGCSSCLYYHHKRHILEKHLNDVHKGAGKVMIVREENPTPVPTPDTIQTAATAPTMDLKPWQCGLCEFNSLLRPEVIEHCMKIHNSKMQFKCPNCPFRTSTAENVSKHKVKSHPESEEDVFYYYYRAGSIPDEADGTPRWKKQRHKMGNPDPEVKTESEPTIASVPLAPLGPISAPPIVDLNNIKKEICEPEVENIIDKLYNRYGKLCDPNGLKYKCPLCKVVMENSKDVMQSHLFEELKYRKWGCSICAYKAFHKRGLNEHMLVEHRQCTASAVELPLDYDIEKWVAKLLEHQSSIIEKNRATASNQNTREPELKSTLASPTPEKPPAAVVVDDALLETLEKAFGQLGTPQGMNFCCPKCAYQTKDEVAFKDHLETELNKIRWRCSNCSTASQTYHEAQRHCKTCTAGKSFAHPVEAVRDPALRSAWLNTVIRVQKQAMNISEGFVQETITNDMVNVPGPLDNSLLVVRYEERVPTPEEEMLVRGKKATSVIFPSLSIQPTSPESDDERLVIDELSKTHEPKKRPTFGTMHECKYCDFTTRYNQAVYTHMLRHYNLKPYSCNHCSYTCYKTQKSSHNMKLHPDKEISFTKTILPSGPPCTSVVSVKGRRKSVFHDVEDKSDKKEDGPKVICLECDKSIPENEKNDHVHNQFGVKGQVVVKCCICLALFIDIDAMQAHHDSQHLPQNLNYAFFKLHHDKREILICGYCNKRFKFLNDMKTHHNTTHTFLQMNYESRPYIPGVNDVPALTDEGEPLSSSKLEDLSLKRIAKKSTTKAPTQKVAKKSTAKLPFYAANEDNESDFEDEDF